MHLINQQTPFMKVLRTEQIMDSYAITRRIEQSQLNSERNVCIRFYALGNGTDIMVSGEAFNNAGGMREFLEEVVELDEQTISEITNRDWEVVATDGEGLELAFVNNVFNWERFGLITCALEEYDVEVIRAAIASGVELHQIGEKYRGKFESFEEFVKQEWDELYLDEVPDSIKLYIDYSKIEVDWDANGGYSYHEGYVFELER